jgi:hypothetical protein
MSLTETKEALKYPIMPSLYTESSSKTSQSRLKLVGMKIVNSRLYLTYSRHYSQFLISHVWFSTLKAYNFTSMRKERVPYQYVKVEIYIFNLQISILVRHIIDKVASLQNLGFNM